MQWSNAHYVICNMYKCIGMYSTGKHNGMQELLIVHPKTTKRLKETFQPLQGRATDNESVSYVHFPKINTIFRNHVIVARVQVIEDEYLINLNLCIQQFEFPRHYSVI